MRLTIRDIQKFKEKNERITMLTAYDAHSARIAESAGIPMLLVGDSLGMVIQGRDSTVPVKIEHMIYHAEIVVRVTNKPFVVTDLPFMTYSISAEQALQNAAKLMQETGTSAVKLEGGQFIAPTIKRITDAGIPVMGHIGLTPQSVNQFGGFRVQGRQIESARKLIADALALQEAGVFAIVLELVPAPLAELISTILTIPTIGIGAGPGCDGQVQVFHDILAMAGEFLPKHAHQYLQTSELMTEAIKQYMSDVIDNSFPTRDHSFSMDAEIIQQLRAELESK